MAKKSEVDWAVEIIMERQEPIYYMELVEEIASRMQKKNDPASLNSIYTRLNLDNRLVFQGDNKWFIDAHKVQRFRKEETKK